MPLILPRWCRATITPRRRIAPAAASVVVLSCCAATAPAGDAWPSFQNGGTCEIGPDELPLRWRADEGIAWTAPLEGYGQSSPVIWAGTIYVTSASGEQKENLHVQALELSTGRRMWSHKLANSTPEKVTGYVSRAAPSPVADGDGIIAAFEGGNLVALRPDGTVRWQRDLVKDHGAIASRHGLASSLEQDRDHVFVWVERSEDPYVLRVAKSTGATAWKSAGTGKTTWSSPRLVPVGTGHHLVLSSSGRIVGLDPATGARLWTLEDVANNSTPTPMPLGAGRFLIGATEGRGEAAAAAPNSNGVVQISAAEGGGFAASFVWRATKARSSFGSPIAANGNAYFVNQVGVVFCVDAATGVERYAQRGASALWATPLAAGGRVYFFGRDGTTTVLGHGAEHQVLAQCSLWPAAPAPPAPPAASAAAAGAQESRATPSGPVLYAAAAAGKRLVLRSGDRLFCVGG